MQRRRILASERHLGFKSDEVLGETEERFRTHGGESTRSRANQLRISLQARALLEFKYIEIGLLQRKSPSMTIKMTT